MTRIYRYTDVARKCYVLVDTYYGDKYPKKYNNSNYLIINTTMATKSSTPELTPMMKQYKDLKAKHPDAILLFRCGDFYETYDSDASIISALLGITLTKNTKTGINMAGFPYHALDTYLPKLIRAGKRCAICDQLDDPKTKTTTKRGITDLITTGEKKDETKDTTMVAEEPVETPEKEAPEPPVTETPDSLIAMVREVINTFNGDIPSTLYEYFGKAIGTLEVITIKRSLKLNLSAEDIDCLYNLAVGSNNKAA